MTVGQKIKKFRLLAGLSQLELARKVGISEPALRNYELGNRTPSPKQLENIAYVLDISPFAISEPNLDVYYGLMQAFFYLEDHFQLEIKMDGLNPVLQFSHRALETPHENSLLETQRARAVIDMLDSWFKEKSALKEGEITKEEYDHWRYSYPKVSAERTRESINAIARAKREQKAKESEET